MGGRTRNDDDSAVTRSVRIVRPSPRHIAIAPRPVTPGRTPSVTPGVIPIPAVAPVPRVIPVPGAIHGTAPGERPIPRVIPAIKAERTVPVVPERRRPAVHEIIVGHISQIFSYNQRVRVQMKAFGEGGKVLGCNRFRRGFPVAGATCVNPVAERIIVGGQLRERTAGRKHHSDAS